MKNAEIPIIIAASGHRDLKNPDAVKQQLREFFAQLKHNLPDTTFCLMSGLAAGADQLFVAAGKEVLANNAEIIAVLPFVSDEYRKDFLGKDLEFYDTALNNAKKIIELPGTRSNESVSYKAVGEYLTENANILVALWDGNVPYSVDGKKICGGTADVVDLWLNYERDRPEMLFSSHKFLDVVKIPVERIDNSCRIKRKYVMQENIKAGCGEIIEWQPGKNRFMKILFHNRNADYALEQINAFNALCRKDDPNRQISKQYLGISDTSGVEHKIERFGILDAFSNFVQKRYIHQFNIIFALSLILGIFAQIYGGVEHNFLSFSVIGRFIRPITLTLPLYFIFFLALFLYSFFQRSSGCDNKYLDYRALAEVLRVDIFWKIAGVDSKVEKYFLSKSKNGLEWIAIAMHNWRALDDAMSGEIENTTDVLKAWVADQHKYYAKKNKLLQQKARKINFWAKLFFIFSFIFGIVFMIDTFMVPIFYGELKEVLYAVNGITVGIGSFLMASLMFLAEKKGWESTADSYKQSAKLFSNILEKIKNSDAETQKIYLLYLGKEALKEHEQWLLSSRQRKPEPNI